VGAPRTPILAAVGLVTRRYAIAVAAGRFTCTAEVLWRSHSTEPRSPALTRLCLTLAVLGAFTRRSIGCTCAAASSAYEHVANVVGRPDRRGNLYPANQRPEQKIDAAVALMMAVGRAMAEDANEGDLTDFLRHLLIA
jgi:hypothetical protein